MRGRAIEKRYPTEIAADRAFRGGTENPLRTVCFSARPRL